MKLIYELEGDRATKCYYLHDDGSKQYVDFWDITTDVVGLVQQFCSWKPNRVREKNYSVLKQQRGE